MPRVKIISRILVFSLGRATVLVRALSFPLATEFMRESFFRTLSTTSWVLSDRSETD